MYQIQRNIAVIAVLEPSNSKCSSSKKAEIDWMKNNVMDGLLHPIVDDGRSFQTVQGKGSKKVRFISTKYFLAQLR